MCVLCERAAMALGDGLLASNLLIDDSNAAFSQSLVASDGVMDLYLHAPGGAVQVSGGGFGGQTIESVPIPQQDQDYIRSIVRRLDAIIDLDFRFVADPGQADVAFYYDTEIEIGGGGQTLGLATTGSAGWELFVNQPALATNQDYRQYVNLHEWGHALGLEHPFEAGDGDVYAGNTNPWTSAYPEETVMAYRSPLNGEWPDFFSTSDLTALVEIWGAEANKPTDFADSLIGQSSDDVISALRGDDVVDAGAGDDLVLGNQGRDQLLGRSGDDSLYGGQDADILLGNEDADRLYGNRGDDTLYGGKGDDRLHGGKGDDLLYGNLGSDCFHLSVGVDRVMDFNVAEGDWIAIAFDTRFSFSQQGADLRIDSDLGTLLLSNITLDQFNASQSIVFE